MLDREHPHHFTLDLHQLDRIFEYRFIQSRSYSFPITSIKLDYMFDTLGFLWLHHDSPQYKIYLLEKLVDGVANERMKPPHSTATTTLSEVVIGASHSFNMNPATTHVQQQAPQAAKVLNAEQRKALELREEKCPVAQ